MRNLEPETIIVLDKIIEKLDTTFALDDKAILEICGEDPKMAETACGILEVDGWIIASRVDQMNYPINIRKSDSFRMMLASGNYTKIAEVEERNLQPVNVVTNFIKAKRSNVAIGNNTSQTNNKTTKFLEKKSLIWMIVTIITIVAGIFTILAYYK